MSDERNEYGKLDKERVEAAVRELLFAIGEDPDREGLQGTPDRVARACAKKAMIPAICLVSRSQSVTVCGHCC